LIYLRRLATTGAAYTAASVLSKLIALFLLPIYTAYLSPADYGAAEVMLASLIAASIVVRLGVIEAILRFYYQAGEQPEAVVRNGFASLFWTTTVLALVALPFAGPISEALLEERDAGLARLAILGLWHITLWEYVLTLLRLDERARTYFTYTIAQVLLTIPVTVALVVGTDLGASAILLGSFGTGVLFLLGRLWVERRRLGLSLDRPLLRRMLRFGLPTMPAELTLYSLSFIDRIIIVRLAGLAEAGLYALAVKFANGMQVLVRGFHLAWPPLAYSIADDEEARRAYALIVSWFVAVIAFAVVGLWLLAPWLVRLLADDRFFEAQEVVGPLAAGTALYALYLVLVVVLGRTGRTELSVPATVTGVVVNITLNLLLVPEYGIIGAGVALGISYVVVVGIMYAIVRRLFPVPYEWRRLATAVALAAGLIAVGETLVSHEGLGGFALTVGLCAAYPAGLWAARFATDEERAQLRGLAARVRGAEIGARSAIGDREAQAEAAIDQAARDMDRGGG
jgi:O-antigen/teichoic acid export membrane protein